MSSGADLRYRNAGDVGVFRTATVDGVAHEDRDLEIDTPTNGKPLDLISQYRSDVVKFSCIGLLKISLADV